MSYPTVEAPYGLVPVNLIGGQVYTGGMRHFPIASAYAGKLWNGDVCKLVAGGTVEKDAVGATATPIGVFMGCQWTDVERGLVNSNYYPGGIVADDIVALVVDDPVIVMKAAVASAAAGVMATVTRAAVGANLAGIEYGSDPVASGRSLLAVDDTPAITAGLPFRVVDVVEETADGAGNYSEVLVVWNAGHQYSNLTGVV